MKDTGNFKSLEGYDENWLRNEYRKNVVRTENWAADDTFRKLEILQENRDRRK